MEPEQRGCASRASSTSSLGREVRCACQYYQSDSLLPERRALFVRPSSRTMQQPPAVHCSEHEYEPIAPPSSLPHPAMAPVVRISETDVMPVADSDDSIDDRNKLPPELILDGGIVLPLDGKIEDNAMEGRELGETGGDTSEEQEPTAQQLNDRFDEQFLNAQTSLTESKTGGEVNTSQVDSSAMEEVPIRRSARGLPQRIKTQAGKLCKRLQNLQRPTFTLKERQKPSKTRSTNNNGKTDKTRAEKQPSRIDQIKTSISEKAKFNLPNRPKFSLPDKSKFHLPERPKFNFTDKSRFHLPDRPKFNIKKPNIHLPSALTRIKRPPSLSEQQQQYSIESNASSKRNIFDFSTYPRIFDRKSKKRGEYATSSPKETRERSEESATFPRVHKKKAFSAKWTQRFGDSTHVKNDQSEVSAAAAADFRSWRHPSLEEPNLSARKEEEIIAAAHSVPWEESRKREQYEEEEIQYMDYEQEDSEMSSDRHPHPQFRKVLRKQEEEYGDEETMEIDPRLYGDQKVKRIQQNDIEENDVERNNWRADQQTMVLEEKFRPIPRSRSLDEEIPRVVEQEAFLDPRRFVSRKMTSDDEEEEEEEEEELEEGEEEHEPSSAQSDREQQPSSGSSCDRRRRGVIEEIDSDEFFLRERGISEGDMNLGKYLSDEIRDALRSEGITALSDEETPPIPPQRPMRSIRKRKEKSIETNGVIPPIRPKRERAIRCSREASMTNDIFRERTRSDSRSDSRHHIVYQAGDQEVTSIQEPLDDIVVVKPARRKSKSSLRSQSQPPMETSILAPSAPAVIMSESSSTPFLSTPPVIPVRRKRSHREAVINRRDNDTVPICNGHHEWETEAMFKKSTTPRSSQSRQSLVEQFAANDIILSVSQEDIEKLEMRLQQEDFVEPIPMPPKRRSRSKTSVAADEDRTSHGAESLPEAGYIEEDIPRDEISSARDLSGYAIIEKREKPPRPPPPRRKRKDKFATTPRPIAPKRPQRAYSTLGPAKSRDTSISGTILSEPIISTTLEPAESIPYIEIDSDDEHIDLRSDKALNKIQGRPLPAPPRPPRIRKEHSITERIPTPFEFATETTTATQTDPLPDDMVIEEEITQAKLIVTPSRSGSQVMVSMERIPSPTRMDTPPVPPLPMPEFLRKEDKEDIRTAYDSVSLTTSLTRETDIEDKNLSSPHLDEHTATEESQPRFIKPTLLSEETLRISSLEVGDLKVDRLSVSQIEAHKIVASEVDAMVITASELRNVGRGSFEESLSPAIIKELIAIRSHLETVASSQAQERQRESEKEITSCKITDIPTTDDIHIQEQEQLQEHSRETAPSVVKESASMEEKNIEADEDQKVVKTDVVNIQEKETSHILPQLTPKDLEFPLSQTLTQTIDQLESKSKDDSTNHLLTVVQDTQDKSLRILDSEQPVTLSSQTSGFLMGEFCDSFPSMDISSTQASELRISPERVTEFPSNFVQITKTTATSKDLRDSKDDVSVSTEQIPRTSRSRSPSPSKHIARQTASPVRSLPPVISVTPDIPDTTPGYSISMDAQPQRAVISYSSDIQDNNIPQDVQSQSTTSPHSSDVRQSLRDTSRGSSQSPIPSFPASPTHFIAFPASEIPAQFFSLSEPSNQHVNSEPGIMDTTHQLLRALRLAGIKAMRHFVNYLTSTLNRNDTREKIREVELVICALLLLIAGLLIYYFSSSHTITHYHHWDYFNPPRQ